MTTSPFKPPYTNNTNPLLVPKPRIVECLHCLYEIETDLPAPMCGMCNHQMITSVNGKLAKRNS